MAYENIQFNPEEKGADFSIFMQGDIIREMIRQGKSEMDAAVEWSKHSAEFRELIQSDPHVEELFGEDHNAAREYVMKNLGLWDETVN